MGLTIEVYKLSALNDLEQRKVRDAFALAPPVLNYDGFHRRVLKGGMTQTKGMSPAQILEKFMSGLDPDPEGQHTPGVIRVDITGFWAASNTIGSATVNGTRQWINRRYLNRYSSQDIVSHVVHETCHRYGWTHAGYGSHKSNSVPYQMGYRFSDAWEEYYSQERKPWAFAPMASDVQVRLVA
jgi:hypothetical protein